MSRPNWRKGQAPSSNINSSQTNDSTSSQNVAPLKNETTVTAASSDSSEVSTALTLSEQHPHFESLNPLHASSLVFFEAVKDFATAAQEVWKDDSLLKKQAKRLGKISSMNQKIAEGTYLANKFHAEFMSMYSDILGQKVSVFDHNVFVIINGKAKFNEASSEVKKTIWEYFKNLVHYSNMVNLYGKCPMNLLKTISSAAGGIMSKIQEGNLDLNAINPLTIGQSLMNDLSKEDLENFGNAVSGDMGNMMSMMQSIVEGGMGEGIPGLRKNEDGGNLGVSMLSSLMSNNNGMLSEMFKKN
jgi:hypothetical protein